MVAGTEGGEVMGVDIETIAEHEAAHAVMRWHRGWGATAVYVSETGGYCDGTWKMIDVESVLLITLAGYSWECGCGIGEIDLKQTRAALSLAEKSKPYLGIGPDGFVPVDDFQCAAAILEKASWLRRWVGPDGDFKLMEVDEAILFHIKKAGEVLLMHYDLVEGLGALLAERRRLSARCVAAVIREHVKAESRAMKLSAKGLLR